MLVMQGNLSINKIIDNKIIEITKFNLKKKYKFRNFIEIVKFQTYPIMTQAMMDYHS